MVLANASTTTYLVVLGRPASQMPMLLRPLLELGNGKEIDSFLPMAHSDDGSNELDEEVR